MNKQLLALIPVILITGCVSTQNIGCSEDSVKSIKSDIENLFEADIQLARIECSGIGNNISAQGTINGSQFTYGRYFSAAAGPSQFSELCFSATNGYFETAKKNACSKLESKNECPAWNQTCGYGYDNSTAVREECLAGAFDSGNVFSVRQYTEYSWIASVSKGSLSC